MIVTGVFCRGTGQACLLNSRSVPATRNSPASGSSPCRATYSANPPPLEIPASSTGAGPSCPASAARKAASSRAGFARL